jgi:FkbM family methyltransferase
MDIEFNYKLNSSSVVFDIGGYRGDFAHWIRKKYNCGVHVFEPIKEHFKYILERFKDDPMYWPYHVALEDTDKVEDIYISDNSSGLYTASDNTESIKVRDIINFIKAFKLNRIDLIKMNCEGSEYKIIDRLKLNDWIKNIDNFVIQFHDIPRFDKQKYIEYFSTTHNINHKCDYWVWLEKIKN